MSDDRDSLFAGLLRRAFGVQTRLRRSAALAGDASTRSYARLWIDGPNAPPTAVAMLLADRGIAMSSDELAVFKEAPRELPYLNIHRFFARIGIAVPEVYLDASGHGVVLLEDIGDVALWDAVQQQPPERVLFLYQRAIDQLLTIEIDGSAAPDPTCIAFQQRFDAKLYNWEFEHFIEHGIEARLGALPAADAEVLRAAFSSIATRLDAQPRVLNHRDFHSWNLYVQGDAIRVIDFQDALLAAAPYDLATLLGDRDTPQVINPDLEQELLDYFRLSWERRGAAPLQPANFTDTYYLCALQKALKVVGRFYYLDRVKRKPGYMRYVPSTVRQIERVLPRFPEYGEMASLLRRYLPR